MKFTNEEWIEIYSDMKSELEQKKAEEAIVNAFRKAANAGLITIYSGDTKINFTTCEGGKLMRARFFVPEEVSDFGYVYCSKIEVSEAGFTAAETYLRRNGITSPGKWHIARMTIEEVLEMEEVESVDELYYGFWDDYDFTDRYCRWYKKEE